MLHLIPLLLLCISQTAVAGDLSIEPFAFGVSGGRISLPEDSRVFIGVSTRININKEREDGVEALCDLGSNGFRNFNLRLVLQSETVYILLGGGVLKFETDYERRFNLGIGFRKNLNRRLKIRWEIDVGILPGRYEGMIDFGSPGSPFVTWNVRLSVGF